MNNNDIKDKILNLYPEFNNIYGPYKRKSDDRKIVILSDGDKKTARQYAKVLLEVKLGRRLKNDEVVDHIDEDPTNDEITNLQLLTHSENAKKKSYTRKIYIIAYNRI
jgi:hypothetical protein